MTSSVFTKWLRESRRGLAGWTTAMVLVGCFYAAFWPTINNPSMQQALDSYPEALLDALNYNNITSPAGYLHATVYGLLVAVLMVVYAATAGTRLIAGDEEAGTLDLVQAHPVSRVSLALQRYAAFAASVLLMSVAIGVAIALMRGPAQLDGITLTGLAAMHVHVVAFGLWFGAISFCVGAATGRRALAVAVGSVIAVLAYAAGGLLPQVDGLAWTKDWSAFTWLTGSEPLRNGVDLAQVGLMLGTAALLVALGTWGYTRRDLRS